MSDTIDNILSCIASRFDDFPNRACQIEIAKAQTSLTCYGDNYNLAVALRAAHQLTLSDTENTIGGGASGPIVSKREGSVGITFAAGESGSAAESTGNKDLKQTSYGRWLMSLSNASCPGIYRAGIGVC